jgi:predicted esterase
MDRIFFLNSFSIKGAMKKVITVIILLFCKNGFSQTQFRDSISKQTFVYAVKDSTKLGLDVYNKTVAHDNNKKPCVIFVFGGAFVGGHRDDTLYKKYFQSLAEHNYIVISISYRLGLRGAKNLSKFNIAPLRKAIDMAVDDVYDATNWVIEHADTLGIDTSKIILSGSSSGAITVLESDFEKRNDASIAKKLPRDFNYAGIIAFSGAILSFDGSLKYKSAPAPVMMFHGTADKIVPYNQIRFLNKGFYGSSSIAKTFRENHYPYFIYREDNLGHEVSILPMYENIPNVLDFLDKFVLQKRPLQIDLDYNDPQAKPLLTLTAQELFKKLQQQGSAAMQK